jgi:hypothetical protein
MRVVLYTDDMEPITVLQLSEFAAKLLEERGRVIIPVMQPIRLTPPATDDLRTSFENDRVTIWAEAFVRKGQRHLFLFTRDEVAAMMLRSDLLPGQRRDAQERERQAYAQGFMRGLATVLGEG